ncbi:unannotated protein [freshwater metagenome]|uniref:Unannotated protein n=1 Tax=freshwater metagenome TaxID=449393 RepID=A0A6J6MVG7_9ZZZZ
MHSPKRALAVVAVVLAGGLSTSTAHAISVAAPWSQAPAKIAFGGSVWTTSTTGAALTFTVKGKSFAMWFTAGPKNGKVAVFVNGKRSRIVDQYSPKTIRRAVVMARAKSTNSVMVVALSTKNKKSKGTKVTVDAFSPNAVRCTKGCVKSPVPHSVPGVVEITGTDQVWYPTAVPSSSSPEWVVAIGSYVRGQDVAPIETAVPVIRAAACDQAKKVPRGVVILSFGAQRAAGSNGFGTLISKDQIIATTSAWATGLAECGTGPWEVSIGTSNSGSVTAYNGYMGGIEWAKIVMAAQVASDPRTVISGSVDLEPGWGPPGQARAWVDGYVRTTTARLWNFGSADGCPQTISTDLTCNNGWTIDDVLWVSGHAGPNIFAMPEIHTKSGALSRQWAVLAARAITMKMPIRIAALTVQTAACTQVKGGCPTTGISAWDAWTQLRKALDAIPSTAGMPLGAPMDIRWGWANGFVIPPPTTTTTTTTTITPPVTEPPPTTTPTTPPAPPPS